jgi:hypothetical protein
MVKKALTAALLLSAAASPVHAQSYTATAPTADVVVCPLEEAMQRLERYNDDFRVQLATRQMPLLNQMKSLNEKVKNPSLPVGAQLSKTEIAQFQKLRWQMLQGQIKGLVFSNYLRDNRVIARAAKVAYELSIGKTFQEHDPDFFYYGVVMMLALEHKPKLSDASIPKNGECTVDAGLYFYEQIAGREADRTYTDFEAAAERLRRLASRYGLDKKTEGWIEKIPSIEERASAHADMKVIQSSQQIVSYVENLENLRTLASVSTLRYSSDKEDFDAARSEEELGHLGARWIDKVKQYDKHTQVLAGLLEVISKQVPSDAAIEANGIAKTLRPSETAP